MYRNIIKPLLDFLAAFTGLLLLSPFLLFLTLLLTIANRGNPFFLQRRPGKNGEIFRIIKFKTMTDAKDSDGNLLPDSDRLTATGKFVRKTSVDEIPQLINVLKADMSLVGPRPLLPEYLELYTPRQQKRHLVRPGITGWAQVNGRNAISWSKKLELDVWYVENLSFLVDIKILWMTFLKVIKSEGVNTANMATTEPFNGNN
ncbi:sugar transferase [Salinimicrobium sediminilitoris]|uniref:sugar transferase n=1 Tax=Salinimicrobium sediminilitoris TaxID=2876715 RepID=UPI001E47B4F0|nr:sugar transferase [Salinimicrobium sediminilitoris]MCC8358732.1 sugar transferase [Salinimicrobium sediminilitoris]